jgi:DNA-binding response OmpR family regulator
MEKTILIIEDDKFLGALMVKKITAAGLKASWSAEGGQGFSKAKEEKPDLVLLDIILPDMEGFEVLKNLKDEDSTKAIPVVILSNLGQKEEIEKGMNLGASDYLVKAQMTPEEILEKVKKLLSK